MFCISLGVALSTLSVYGQAARYQWSVKLPDLISQETNANPEAFLWIPQDCNRVRGVVIGQHNMSEETLFHHPSFREAMRDAGLAIVWITPGIDQLWDEAKGTPAAFD